MGRRSMVMQKVNDGVTKGMSVPQLLLAGASHPYGCRCELCQEYWTLIGRDEDGLWGPFSEEEMVEWYTARGREIPVFVPEPPEERDLPTEERITEMFILNGELIFQGTSPSNTIYAPGEIIVLPHNRLRLKVVKAEFNGVNIIVEVSIH